MDLKQPTTTTTATAAAGSPDTDGETPLHSQLVKPLSSFPNEKKHQHHHHHHPPPCTVVAYKECLKNHAATIGSHAVDGCGEFMPSPPEPTSLKCAACGCHRNFHRREPINDCYTTTTATNKTQFIEFHHHPPPEAPQPTNYAYAPHVLLSLTTGDQTHTVATPGTPAAIKFEHSNGRKRFRTKFSQEQKEKMSLFAEKVGWKMQRCDDNMVTNLCNELGIRRGILKVWMHNNKNTIGKKDKETNSPTTAATVTATTTATPGVSKSIDIYNNNNNSRLVVSSESHDEEDVNVDGRDNSSSDQENGGGGGGGGGGGCCGGGVHLQASTNGSSSSC